MEEWKQDKNTRKVYQDLYNPSNPDDDKSDTYVTLIIKSVFVSEKEHTIQNAKWVQSVLETIFDVKCSSSKIDTDIIETWNKVITDTEMVNNLTNFILYFKVTNVKILYIYLGIE